jgi:hypothetical protein
MSWDLILLACFLRLLFAMIVINALLMMLSPTAWHRTPWWFRSMSGIPGDRLAHGRSTLWIRLTGTVLLVISIGLVYSIVCRPQPKTSTYLVRTKPDSQ